MAQMGKLFCLVLAVLAVDARKKSKEDPGMIIRCMAENYAAGEQQIAACRDCFKVIGDDLLTESGLAAAKECSAKYLPLEMEACADVVEQLSPGDEEKGGEVIECFDEVLKNHTLNLLN